MLTLDSSRLLSEASEKFRQQLSALRKSLNTIAKDLQPDYKQDAESGNDLLSGQDNASLNPDKACDRFLAALEYFDTYEDFELTVSLKNMKRASTVLCETYGSAFQVN